MSSIRCLAEHGSPWQVSVISEVRRLLMSVDMSNPEDKCWVREMIQLINDSSVRLNRRRAAVLRRRHVKGHNYVEIAKSLRVSTGRVRQIEYATRERIENRLMVLLLSDGELKKLAATTKGAST